jgi:hypothetical protein
MKTARSHAVIAALWMSGTLVSFMLMAIGGRQLSGRLTTFQILFFRSIKGTPDRPNRSTDKKNNRAARGQRQNKLIKSTLLTFSTYPVKSVDLKLP